MDLPQALKPWALYLNLFPLPVKDRLGALVPRLDRLLGPLESVGDAELGEPEGYEGIDRRGSYDRLLMSEWLLAEEVPEEFLRRASSGEHAFIQLGRVKPAGNRTVLAVFDCGPSQLGSPRIAQIALMIVLARRADASGAKFEWGVLQDPYGDVLSGVNEVSLARFIKRRFAFEANTEHIAYWWDCFGSDTAGSWLIGGARITERKQSLSLPRITIDPQFDGETDRLTVSVLQPGRQTTSATLVVPDPPVCIRLLRFLSADKPASPAVTRGKIISNIGFTNTNRFLFGRIADDTVLVHNVPATSFQPAGKPKVYAASGQRKVVACAFGRHRRAAILVSVHKESPTLTVESIGGRQHYSTVDVALPEEMGNDCVLLRGNMLELQHCAVYLDGLCQKLYTKINDKLVALPLNGERTTAEIVHREVGKFVPFGPNLIYAASSDTGVTVNSWKPGEVEGKSSNPVAPLSYAIASFPDNLFLGFGRCWKSPPGYIAYAAESGDWVVVSDKKEHKYEVGDGVVVGAFGRPGHEYPALLVRDGSGCELLALGKGWSERLPRTTAKIVSVAVGFDGEIAYLSESGEIVVYSFNSGSVTYRVVPEGA